MREARAHYVVEDVELEAMVAALQARCREALIYIMASPEEPAPPDTPRLSEITSLPTLGSRRLLQPVDSPTQPSAVVVLRDWRPQI